MPEYQVESGLAPVNGALIYYETAGEGQPLVMIHAGVADHRQWNNEFARFAKSYRVLRYDLRGYGESEPVEGDFSHLADLVALLEYLQLSQPLILIGCSMGGGMALEFALEHPERVTALILLGSGPEGLVLDVPVPPILAEAEQAYKAGDLDRTAELETRAWFDGVGRTLDRVDPAMRQLAYEMNRTALAHDAKGLGKRLPDTQTPAAGRLDALTVPVLALVGANDFPYAHLAAGIMADKIPVAQKAVIPAAAHLANMDQPAEFQRLVAEFLDRHAAPHA
jgi:pimeloyl-ACP methyl ester carboxylesterase